ncbi:uncharacterized protein LOC129600358 [Paramacrobiotus metropolitanus]|uniref:uncharacterized protein LOC129600358 n=1 Tax=Paramacrobiotus metropolitanus TaxID=2943436 RepID=UPI0024461953|nr:uncharacterized protein LOC129600358 [Paramacrobiotus metropolitanus]
MAKFISPFVCFCYCFVAICLQQAHAATLPQDWRNRIDPSVLESRESESGICNLDEEIELPEGNVFALSISTGKLLPQNYWPNGGKNIPYKIAHGFEESARRKIKRGMADIKRVTVGCITFTPRTNQTDYLFFRPHDKWCQSRVGRRFNGGRQDIRLTKACANYTGTIQHEILHALGLYHEQNRPDRDQYVDIFQDNIRPDVMQNFHVLPHMEVYDTHYDFDSVMHYGAMDFAKDPNQPTIIPKVTKRTHMGQRRSLSILDVAKLQKAYGCQFDPDNEEANDPVASMPPTQMTTTVPETTEATEKPPDRQQQQRMTPKAPILPVTPELPAFTPISTEFQDEEFPEFSDEPMTESQCSFQFRPGCGREHYTRATCTHTKGLEIDCKGIIPAVLSDMVRKSARRPMRAVRVDIDDGHDTLTPAIFAPIRLQIIGLELWNCRTRRTTEKLRLLKFSRMYHFEAVQCRNLDIRRSDFDTSRNLRMILFRSSTFARMEEDTFGNLPDLQLLSLEYERTRRPTIPLIPRDQLDNVKRVHCSCQFEWLRQLFDRKPELLDGRQQGEVYLIDDAFESPKIEVEQIYYPFHCRLNGYSSFTRFRENPFSRYADEC